MTDRADELGPARPHLLQLLPMVLSLVALAVVVVGAGSYLLLRSQAIESARSQAAERLDDVFQKIDEVAPIRGRERPFFELLRGQITVQPVDDGPSDRDVQEVPTPEITTPHTLLVFDPGDGLPLIFDPDTIGTVEETGDDFLILRRVETHMSAEETRRTEHVYYGAQRYWPESEARLIMASRIAPVDQLIGQIAIFTGFVILVLIASIAFVLWMAQRDFDRQMRSIREASTAIANSEDRERRFPISAHTELGRLFSHINAMLDKIHARGRLLQQHSFSLDHDYRDPIAQVIAYARQAIKLSEAETKTAGKAEQLAEAMKGIHKVAEEMDRAARERLEIYKFDLAVTEGDDKLLEAIDLAELAQDAIDSCWMLKEDRGVICTVIAPSPVWVRGSRSLLTRALVNLVKNAVMQSKPGQEVSIHALQVDGVPQLQVHDAAGGLKAETLEAIGQLTQKAVPIASSRPDGTGLGLQFAHYVMVVHRGALGAENYRDGAILKLFLKPGLS